MLKKSVTDTQLQEKGALSLKNRYFVRDLVLTLLAAVFTGVSGSILLILLVFGWNTAVADDHHQLQAEPQPRSYTSGRAG